MIKNYLFVLLIAFSINNSFSQEVQVSIQSPFINQITSEDLFVEVSLVSTYEILTVEANIDGNVTVLQPTDNGNFAGQVNLLNLPQGIYTLQITAVDFFGNTDTQDRVFIFDTKPELICNHPNNHSIARPEIFIEFEGSDIISDLPVQLTYDVKLINENGITYPLIVNSNTAISQDLDLSPYLNTEVTLLLQVTDIRGQTTTLRRQIYVDNSNTLSVEYEVQNKIVDFDGDNLLFVTKDYIWSPLHNNFKYEIKALTRENIISEVTMDIPLPIDKTLLEEIEFYELINLGAIFKAKDFDVLNSRLYYLWNSNTNITTEIGYTGFDEYDEENYFVDILENSIVQDDLFFSLGVCVFIEMPSGAFIVECEPHYFVQDILNPTSVNYLDGFHGQDTYDTVEQIFSNGDVLYYYNGNILLKSDESITNITTDGGDMTSINNKNVKSDGNLYVYTKRNISQQTNSIILNDGNQESILRPASDDNNSFISYEINSGNVVYNKKGNLGQELIMLRKPDGSIFTVSPFASDSQIEEVNELGEVMFINDNKRYLYSQGDFNQISNNHLGKPYYFNSNWYIAIGNTLFLFNNLPLSSAEQLVTQQNLITIYPNPAFEEVNIKLDMSLNDQNFQFTIFNLIGKKMLEGKIMANTYNSNKINISNLNSGTYFLSIFNSRNKITKKIIKK